MAVTAFTTTPPQHAPMEEAPTDYRAKEEQLVTAIKPIVLHLARTRACKYRWQLHQDELVGELWMEVAKALRAYGDKPYQELYALTRTMLNNRLLELYKLTFRTHRKVEGEVMQLDHAPHEERPSGDEDPLDVAGGDSTEELVASRERLVSTLASLSPRARHLLVVLLKGDVDVPNIAHWRKVATAMGWKYAVVQACYEEIRNVYALVCHGDIAPRWLREEEGVVDFALEDLEAIAAELECPVPDHDRDGLEAALNRDLAVNGVPEPESEMSHRLRIYLALRGTPGYDLPREPECVGFYSAHDPACVPCAYDFHCARVCREAYPACHAQLFEDDSEECAACLVRGSCGKLADASNGG